MGAIGTIVGIAVLLGVIAAWYTLSGYEIVLEPPRTNPVDRLLKGEPSEPAGDVPGDPSVPAPGAGGAEPVTPPDDPPGTGIEPDPPPGDPPRPGVDPVPPVEEVPGTVPPKETGALPPSTKPPADGAPSVGPGGITGDDVAPPVDPPVRREPGSEPRDPDVMDLPARIAPLLRQAGQPVPAILEDGIITYSTAVYPRVDDPGIITRSLEAAIAAWEQSNRGISFSESDDPEVSISWRTEPWNDSVGWANCFFYTEIYECELEIAVGGTSCSGTYVQADMEDVTNTIMHEIGHVLDIGHTSDETHLMHGVDPPPSDPLDLMGYRVPEKLETQGDRNDREKTALDAALAGLDDELAGLNREQAVLDSDLEVLDEELGRLKAELQSLEDRRAAGEYGARLELDVNEYNRWNDDYNTRSDAYNIRLDDYNARSDDYNRRIEIHNQRVEDLDALVERSNAYTTEPCYHLYN